MAKPVRACQAITNGAMCPLAGEHMQVWKTDSLTIRVFLCEKHRRERVSVDAAVVELDDVSHLTEPDDTSRDALYKWAAEELEAARDLLELSPETRALMSNQALGLLSTARVVLNDQLESVHMELIAKRLTEDTSQDDAQTA